jgi:3-dehydroquinate synthase
MPAVSALPRRKGQAKLPSLQMDLIERTIHATWRHRVFFSDHILDPTNQVLRDVLVYDDRRRTSKALVVVDESLAAAQPGLEARVVQYFAASEPALTLARSPLISPGGEAAKSTWSNVAALHAAINDHHIDRQSYVVAMGGGALLDLVGLAATTAHRGVRHVRIPTTTLSQCDSGVGVKNGINAFGKKNFIGTFCPPFAVINDFHFLESLSERDKRAGYVEAVKVACIRDADFFAALEEAASALACFEPQAMRRLISRCAELHLNHIAGGGDPFETGSARPLDFGHWAAHKLEQLSRFHLRHGEAVAIGIALDVIYSRRRGFLPPTIAERILRLLEKLGFDLFAAELLQENSEGRLVVLEGLDEFREHLGGRLTITLLGGIGGGFEVHEMESGPVTDAIQELKQRHDARRKNG